MKERGLTLIEMLMTLVIVSILAAIAFPMAEVISKRDKEHELRRALREIRTSIDRFHTDWEQKKIPTDAEGVSADGYPKGLNVLVNGVEGTGGTRLTVKYLRGIPKDPFADPNSSSEDQWLLRSYKDDSRNAEWGGEDVYDVHSRSASRALDGTLYADW